MKFIVEKSVINLPLQYAAGFTMIKNLSTILQNVYIEANAELGEVTIKATNYQIGFSSTIKAEVISGGVITVDAGIHKNITVLPDGEITFELKGDTLIVTQEGEAGGNIVFRLPILNPDLFPKSPAISSDYSFKINGKLFVDLLKRVVFCVSTDSARIEYNGVHLSVFADHIEVSASDLQRIANAKATIDEPIKDEFSINILKITVLDIIKIFENEPYIFVETDKKHVSFSSERTVVTSKLIEKNVTRITKLFYDPFSIKAIINRKKLYEALKRMSSSAGEQTFSVKFDFSGSNLDLASLGNEKEGRDDTIRDVVINEEKFSTVLNSKLLLEILSNIGTEKVVFNFNLKDKPILIYPEDENARYIMVPIITERYM
ncbi:MAG: DNA polymerase III subunit beta [Deferribacteraceae bacterium]|jgi:DNA polymerase-3 subunit beta|nr:DNA polymerase III subunit beta [Deferribacteraceae bacterium]